MTDRHAPLDALRSAIVLAVVLLHAMMAYFSFAPSAQIAEAGGLPLWAAIGVVDAQRFAGFDLPVMFIDIFCMALMFFVSGLFVSQSLARKGAGGFLAGRVKRLGIPFVFAAGLLAPLAYYPSWLSRGGDGTLASYAHDWLALPAWQAGPAWFLWVLLAFAVLAALLQGIAPGWTGRLGRLAQHADTKPWRIFLGLTLLSGGGYIAMNAIYESYEWLMWGPFFVQTSRILHYAVYFFAGVAVGAAGLDAGLLAPDGKLARRWWLFALLALPAFISVIAVLAIAFSSGPNIPLATLKVAGGIAFVLTCAAICFALIGFFVHRMRRRTALGRSLDRNAYGIYLIHYAFIGWMQYALLPHAIGGLQKGLIVFASATIASWIAVILVRRLPAVGRII